MDEEVNPSTFSTFCHISQYGDAGYLALPRMIAMSQPCLWAPSSVILKSDTSGLSPRTFLRYLDGGQLRIFGRYEWLYDPRWRNSQRWPGTAWNSEIDGRIRNICDEDSGKPKNERRVVVAPPEQGYEFAEVYLDENPKEVTRWLHVLQDSRRRLAIPGGTREAALRDIDKPVLAARRILRDAYNHGQAVAYSEANAPFLAQQVHRKFLRILADAPSADDKASQTCSPEASEQKSLEASDLQIGVLTSQLLEILEELDIHAKDRSDVDGLDRFIREEGRADLMLWMGRICTLLKRTKIQELDGLLVERLRSDLQVSRFPSALEGLLHRKDEAALAVVGMASTLIGLATDPAGSATLLGVAASAYPVGKGLIRQLGYAPAEFTGPQWPFLYTYGTRAKKKQLKELRYVLDELHRREA